MLVFDFETYSEAGYFWDEKALKWRGLSPTKSGIAVVGAWCYAEHPSTEVICMAVEGQPLWEPGMAPPLALFAHIANGGLLEAHNSFFEYCIWLHVCHRRMGWPELPLEQLRCTQSRCRAWSIPAALGKAGKALDLPVQKDKAGENLIQKLSIPKSPTKTQIKGGAMLW